MSEKETLRLPSSMLLRDAISALNARFLTSAVVVDPAGDVLGVLDGESIARCLALDADTLLKSRCADIIVRRTAMLAA